jgi:peptide/nickel transport system substrate-binding protein
MGDDSNRTVKLGGEEIDIGPLTRRRALQMAGAMGVTGLAGCSGDGGGDGGDTTTEATTTETMGGDTTMGGGDDTTTEAGTVTEEEGDVTLRSAVEWQFTTNDMSLNRGFGPSPTPPQWFCFFTPITSFAPLENEWKAELGDGFPFAEGCTMNVPLKPDTYYWWDGTEVTAEDRVYWHQTAAILNAGGLDQVPWEAQFGEDEHVFKENKVGQPSEEFMKQNMNRAPDGKKSVWQPIWEAARDATSEEESNAVAEDAAQLNLGIEATQPDDKGYGHGLWRPDDWSTTSITWVQHEDHPYAGESDIDKWEWQITNNRQTLFQTIEQNNLDTTTLDLAATDQVSAPDDMESAYSYDGLVGKQIAFKARTDHLKRRKVRRAILFYLDYEQLASIVEGSGATAIENETGGLPDRAVRDFLPDDGFLDELIQYGPGRKEDEAEAAMQDAGYTREGGRWVGPNGNAITGLEFISPSGAEDALIANTISSQLQEFGVGNSLITLEGTQFQNRVNEERDFDIVVQQQQVRSATDPDAFFNDFFRAGRDFRRVASPESCEPSIEDGTGFPVIEYDTTEGQFTGPTGLTVNPTPPYPGLDNVGARDLVEEVTIDPPQLQYNLRVAFPKEQQVEWAKQISWYNNFHAMERPLFSYDVAQWMDTANFEVTNESRIRGTGPQKIPVNWGGVSSR